jgi:hypothetical protein
MRVALAAVILASVGLAGLGAEAHYCSAPLSDWQPRETFEKKLQSEGWSDIAIRVEDGCYLVHASNARGDRLHGKFDPVTLAPLPSDGGRHHHHHDDAGEEDHGPGEE